MPQHHPPELGQDDFQAVEIWSLTRGSLGMSAGCSTSEIRAECREREMSTEDARAMVDLVAAVAAGANDGETRSCAGEPIQMGKPGVDSKPAENLPLEDMLDARRVRDGAYRATEPVLAGWRANLGEFSLLRRGVSVRVDTPALLAQIGIDPTSLLPADWFDRMAQEIAGRDVRYLPEYFEPLLTHLGAAEIVRFFGS